MKKLFFISDIHGHYNEMINALEQAGYNENDPSHLLVVLGDSFDRGSQSLDIYKYLKRLTAENKAIVTMGNHTKFLIEYLDGTSISPFNYLNNGTDETLADFLHQTKPFETWCLLNNIEPTYGSFACWIKEAREQINQEFPDLLPWLKALPRYFESANYIGVHGAIDTKVEDWHYPHCTRHGLIDWDALDFNDGSFFGQSICNTPKTIIIGHFGTSVLRERYGLSTEEDDYSILYREDGRVIAIDATTVLSHQVNVLVVEDELEGEKL